MSDRLTNSQLDEILALQLTVAWAGESAGDRLGWWKTDLVDKEGGGDLFARLAPKTAPWASLFLVRAVACRIDELARENIAGGDKMWTLFHLGFAVDEQILDRLVYHRSHQHDPSEVLGPRFLVGKPWSKSAFTKLLESLGSPKVTITPSGRHVQGKVAGPSDLVPMLAAALLPLKETYQVAYVEAPK